MQVVWVVLIATSQSHAIMAFEDETLRRWPSGDK